jgi:hypothetical protein
MAKNQKPKVFDQTNLEKKSTKELLGYLRRLHQCEESFESSDMAINEDLNDSDTIYFKQTEKWKRAYDMVKLILSKREHL